MAREAAQIRDAPVSTAASGDTTIVPANSNGRIVVHSYALVAAGAVACKWKSGATDKSGAMPFIANGGIAATGGIDTRWFLCGLGEALILNLDGAVQVSGHVAFTYE